MRKFGAFEAFNARHNYFAAASKWVEKIFLEVKLGYSRAFSDNFLHVFVFCSIDLLGKQFFHEFGWVFWMDGYVTIGLSSGPHVDERHRPPLTLLTLTLT